MDQAKATERTAALVESLEAECLNTQYTQLQPSVQLGYPFKSIAVSDAYLEWPLLPELFPMSFTGVKTSRDDVLVDIDRDRLVARMETYFDPERSDAEIEQLIPGVMKSTKRFNAHAIRSQLVKRGFLPDNVIRYAYRPFDVRWLYWEPATKLLDEKREEYLPHVGEWNRWFTVTQRNRRSDFYLPLVTSRTIDINASDGSVTAIPIWRLIDSEQGTMAGDHRNANISPLGSEYLKIVNSCPDAIFFHSVATMYATRYRMENEGALKMDWARIPLPTNGDRLAASAELGRKLAVLLDIEQDVPGVGSGMVRPELRSIAVLSRVGGGNIDAGSDDLAVTASWGRGGNGKPVAAGRGRVVERNTRAEETDCLGALTHDVYLNEDVYWQNVPERVWNYSLGGYQVLKKWLSYREDSVLGRRLKPGEVRTFTQIARRIAAILMLEEELDASYLACSAETWDWPAAVAAANPQRPLFPGLT
ncbi:MAG: type ISP restriction/modification enzyme [Thermomicrobiales bacterium]